MEITAIAAVARNGVIGADGDIPWRIPEDWQRFKRVTVGQVLVMGRKTFDSIGRPLPGRTTVVVTRDPTWRPAERSTGEGGSASVASSVDEALDLAARIAPATTFVAGGGEIYRAAWPRLTRLDITEVDQEPAGDATFPSIEAAEWVETAREPHHGFAFVSYRRR